MCTNLSHTTESGDLPQLTTHIVDDVQGGSPGVAFYTFLGERGWQRLQLVRSTFLPVQKHDFPGRLMVNNIKADCSNHCP